MTTHKAICFICLFTLFYSACDESNLSHTDVVQAYYEARNAQDFDEVIIHVNDSLTIIEGSYIMPYDKYSYYQVFKWDSIFQPSYDIINLEEKSDQVMATISIHSIRNEFLNNPSMSCQFLLSFSDNKISKIESLDCRNVDWRLWSQKRDSLVNWIHNTHPHLDGFIHEMTPIGAIKYLKAIELYEAFKE